MCVVPGIGVCVNWHESDLTRFKCKERKRRWEQRSCHTQNLKHCAISLDPEQTAPSGILKIDSQVHQTHSSLSALHPATFLWPHTDAAGTTAFFGYKDFCCWWRSLVKLWEVAGVLQRNQRDGVASETASLEPRTSRCYETMNHSYASAGLRQSVCLLIQQRCCFKRRCNWLGK